MFPTVDNMASKELREIPFKVNKQLNRVTTLSIPKKTLLAMFFLVCLPFYLSFTEHVLIPKGA
jgi:hypothetical protein